MLVNYLKFLALVLLAHTLSCAEIVRVELRDVQGLWGGQDIVLRKDNVLLTTEVKEGKAVCRDGQVKFIDVIHAINPNQLDGYVENKRSGVPDEARPIIRLYYENGAMREYGKWANDKNSEFDQVYLALLKLMKISGLKESSGVYDWKLRG